MELEHRQRLESCRPSLLQDIKDPAPFLDAMIVEELTSPGKEDYQKITALRTNEEKTQAFLDLLPTLGPGAYTCFLKRLRRERPHLAALLDGNGGQFQDIQDVVRRSYVQLAQETTALDYESRSATTRGLEQVYVDVSALHFDKVADLFQQSDRARKAQVGGAASDFRRNTFQASLSQGETMELSLSRLVCCEGGKPAGSCLLVGQAGVGKTLLLQRLMAAWAQRTMQELSRFEFVLYVSACDSKVQVAENGEGVLRAALGQYDFHDEALAAVAGYLKRNSKQLLLLIDSVDEAGEQWLKCRGLHQILRRQSVDDCSIVVTSRPCSAAYMLVPKCTVRYYITGLSNERLEELLMARLGTEKAQQLAGSLKSAERAHLHELMKAMPLVASMVAELAKEEELELPPLTMTQTYTAMALSMLDRQQQKAAKQTYEGEELFATCFEELHADVQAALLELGQFALEMLKASCSVFHAQTVQRRCGEPVLHMGFLAQFQCLSSLRPQRRVQFCHLSWQEYFAAYALMKSPLLVSEQFKTALDECVTKVGVGEETELFWKFAAGHAQGEQLAMLMRMLSTARKQQMQGGDLGHWALLTCQCFYEAMQPLLAEGRTADDCHEMATAADVLPAKLDLRHIMLSAMETHTLAVTLQWARVSQLDLAGCGLNAKLCDAFRNGACHLRDLDMDNNPGLHDDGLATLASSLSSCEQLEKLSLDGCQLDDSDCKALGSIVSSVASLRSLSIGLNFVGREGVAVLQPYLSKSNIEVLILNDNSLRSDSGGVLSELIAQSEHLQALSVCNNDLDNNGVKKVMMGVEKSHSLKQLELSFTCESFDDSTLWSVTSSITHRWDQHNDAWLQRRRVPLTVCLHGNNLTKAALEQVAHSRSLPSSCKDCIVSDSNVLANGVLRQQTFRPLFEAYAHNGSKGDLSLAYEGVDDTGAKDVSILLREGQHGVQALNLFRNSVGDGGCTVLGEALHVESSLVGLRLGFNRITGPGFCALAESLTGTASRPSLLYLGLTSNQLFSGTRTEEEQCHARLMLGKLIGTNCLRYLSLGCTGVGFAECSVISSALAQPQCSLIFLVLKSNGITDEGVCMLCHGVKANTSLRYLDLSDNSITAKGGEAVSLCLASRDRKDRPIQRVWMGKNPVGREAMTGCMVVEAFRGFRSIMACIENALQ